MPIANIDVKFPRVGNYKENGVVFPIASTTSVIKGQPRFQTTSHWWPLINSRLHLLHEEKDKI
jgi:hypothetical protein